MKTHFAWIGFLIAGSSAQASVSYDCALQALVVDQKTLVTFTDPIRKEVVLEQNAGGYQSPSVIMFDREGLVLKVEIGSYGGHTDMTVYLYDAQNTLLASAAGMSESRDGNVADYVATHFYNPGASISLLKFECDLRE